VTRQRPTKRMQPLPLCAAADPRRWMDGQELREGLRMRRRMRIRLQRVSGARLVHILIPTLALLSLVAAPREPHSPTRSSAWAS
jgi:hypothetical protein